MDPENPAPARTLSLPVKQFALYVVIGLLALALDVLVFWACRALGWPLWWANPVARLAGAVAAFCLHHRLTFRQRTDRQAWGKASWRYVLLWLGATAVATGCIPLLVGWGLDEVFSKVLVEGAMPIVNFVLARHWVFANPRKSLE